jgi:hypothetical protein
VCAESITFGKFHKPHPCNLREFKIYGGQSPNPAQMSLLYHGGLKNDSIPETFDLRIVNSEGIVRSKHSSPRPLTRFMFLIPPVSQLFPVRYIRLEPLLAHSYNYNLSIWSVTALFARPVYTVRSSLRHLSGIRHVALSGNAGDELMDKICRQYSTVRAYDVDSSPQKTDDTVDLQFREEKTLKLILKHLRQRALLPAFRTLQSVTSLNLEHPLLTSLHTAFVLRGDFNMVESLLSRSASLGLFDSFIRSTPPRAHWRRLDTDPSTSSPDGDYPSARGGHQLVLDPDKGLLYLFGGWDGTKDLCDLWTFSIQEQRWHLVCGDTREVRGPGPRSCHKGALDERTGHLWVLGRFIDNANKVEDPRVFDSDFWRYHTRGPDEGRWEKMSQDTGSEGGPKMMCAGNLVCSVPPPPRLTLL